MDDDEALLALGAGDDEQQAAARAVLADRYFEKLFVRLKRELGEALAEAVTTGAFMRLWRTAAARPDELPYGKSVMAWLFRAGLLEQIDERRRNRGRQRTQVCSIPEDGDCPEDRRRPRELSALEREMTADMARETLRFILGLEQPARGILLFDFINTYEELTGGEFSLHDEELLDCTREYEVWSRDALRSARTRARVALKEFFKRRGFDA